MDKVWICFHVDCPCEGLHPNGAHELRAVSESAPWAGYTNSHPLLGPCAERHEPFAQC